MIDIRARIPGLQASDWHHSNRLFLATFGGMLAAVYLFILLVDPYGVVPFSPPFDRPIVTSQRQMYPQILRTGRYDSIVVGTSTVRLLDPAALGRVFGGHFASFAMPSATAREQVRLIAFFRRMVAAPRAVLIGLDHEWCNRAGSAAARDNADVRDREFPAWAFDDNRWNDLFYLLNDPTLEAAGRTLGRLLGLIPEKLRDDGFEVFVGPEATYDLARARDHLYGPLPEPLREPAAPRDETDAKMSESLEWLDDGLGALPEATRKVLVFPPLHAHSMPSPGSPGAARYEACKQRAAAIARRRGALLVDWRFVSPLTAEDSHFWDPLHYRLPVAYGLIDDLAHVINEGRDSPDGSYRVLVR
jgi:hypothetical protein